MCSKWSPKDLDIKSARLSASLSEAILGTILETILDTILDEENSAAQQTPKSKMGTAVSRSELNWFLTLSCCSCCC